MPLPHSFGEERLVYVGHRWPTLHAMPQNTAVRSPWSGLSSPEPDLGRDACKFAHGLATRPSKNQSHTLERHKRSLGRTSYEQQPLVKCLFLPDSVLGMDEDAQHIPQANCQSLAATSAVASSSNNLRLGVLARRLSQIRCTQEALSAFLGVESVWHFQWKAFVNASHRHNHNQPAKRQDRARNIPTAETETAKMWKRSETGPQCELGCKH